MNVSEFRNSGEGLVYSFSMENPHPALPLGEGNV